MKDVENVHPPPLFFRPFLTAKYFREIFVQIFCRQIFFRRTIWEIWKASYGSEIYISGFMAGSEGVSIRGDRGKKERELFLSV